MMKILYVGLGGFIGAALRYVISTHFYRNINSSIPLGTLTVNVLGGLLIGLIMELALQRNLIPDDLKLFLTTGILGGLTTFSTFSYETINLLGSSYIWGCLNILLNLFLSLIGVVVGRFIAMKVIT